MSTAPWPAPAKLNLFLRILGRRADGYHEIQTLFQLVDLADELRFSVRSDSVIRRVAGPASIAADGDLSLRAARLLQAESRTGQGADLWLNKRIPVMGGLGGGSSDAATVLVALNRLWNLQWPAERLADLGRRLGADVPLFVHGRTAWGEGIGERLTPVDLPARHYAIIHPGVGVSTAGVFQAPELTRNSPRTTIRGFLREGAANDCEAVVCARYPEVARALAWLGARGEARLTGTGSSVFAAFDERASAAASLEGLPAGWTGYVAQGLARSPVLDRLGGLSNWGVAKW